VDPAVRGWIILAAAVLVAIAVVDVVRRLVTRRLAKHWPTVAYELTPVARPAFILGALAAFRATIPGTGLPTSVAAPVARLLTLALIAAVTWLIIEVIYAASDIYLTHLSSVSGQKSRRARRTRTQLTMVRRTAGAIIGVIGVGAMLFTFPAVKALGAGVMASAGVIGIVAGIAAQATLGNMFAGLQLAFSDALRIGDIVVVQGEYGTIEQLTLTYVTVQTWDERRLVMPVSYFTQTPFENWTKDSNQLLGTVYLRVDWTVPIAELRTAAHAWLSDNPNWDGRSWSMVLTDVLDNGLVEVRATVSAVDADQIWAIRCELREWLITYLRENHPNALPRIRTELSGQEADRAPRDRPWPESAFDGR